VRNGTPYVSLTYGDTTSLETNFVKRSFKVHFGIRGLIHHTILAKGGNTKEVVNGLPIQCGEFYFLV
jgi:hypothetical protein